MSDIVYKNFAFSTPFLQGFKEMKIPIIDSEGNPTWPEVFPIFRIEKLRRRVGQRHFSSQMLLKYVAPEKLRLDPEALHFYSEEFNAHVARIGDVLITGAAVYWNPSLATEKSDNSVCVLIYRDDKNKRIFVHDILYLTAEEGDLHPLASQCDRVLDFMKNHHIRRIVVETNGLGNALPEIIREVANSRKINIYVQKQVNVKNKETRILDAIEPLLSTGRLHAHFRIKSTPLITEMFDWSAAGGAPSGDDGLDALSGAICALPTPVRPLEQTVKTFTANINFKL